MILAVGVVLFLVALVLLGTYFLEPSTKTTTFKRVSVNEAKNVASSQQKIKPQKSLTKKPKLTFKELLFKAGIVSDVELKKFYLISAISPVIGFGVGFLIGFLVGYSTIANGLGILGAILGFIYPKFYLRSRMKKRQDEISYYLPLVIEQIAIGVSSSLDIGPCIQLVLELADERQTHNAVTELLKLAVQMSRQGIPFDEALLEIGKFSGNVELKHCFLALGQVYKHGGEISKQLMEIANSVAVQRQIKIDEKIKKLPVKGVLIVGILLFGFLTLVLFGLGKTIVSQLSGVMSPKEEMVKTD